MPILKRTKPSFSAPTVPDLKWAKPSFSAPTVPDLKWAKPSFSAPTVPDLKWAKPGRSQTLEQVPPAVDHAVHEVAGRVADAAGAVQSKAGERVTKARNTSLPNIPTPALAVPRVAKRPQFKLRSRKKKSLRDQIGGGAATDALMRAQLARTSRQLAQESTDLGQAVGSLKETIKLDRKRARAARRRRLTGNMVLGAVVMYHLDPAEGRERRQATARRIKRASGWLQGLRT